MKTDKIYDVLKFFNSLDSPITLRIIQFDNDCSHGGEMLFIDQTTTFILPDTQGGRLGSRYVNNSIYELQKGRQPAHKGPL